MGNNIVNGIYKCVTGTVIFNEKQYEGVNLLSLFSFENGKFVANPDIIIETGESFHYDEDIIPITKKSRDDLISEFMFLTSLAPHFVSSKLVTLIESQKDKLEALQNIILLVSYRETLGQLEDMILFKELFDNIFAELTDWELEMMIQELFCKAVSHVFVEENMKYEDEIETNNLGQSNDEDENLIKEIRCNLGTVEIS